MLDAPPNTGIIVFCIGVQDLHLPDYKSTLKQSIAEPVFYPADMDVLEAGLMQHRDHIGMVLIEFTTEESLNQIGELLDRKKLLCPVAIVLENRSYPDIFHFAEFHNYFTWTRPRIKESDFLLFLEQKLDRFIDEALKKRVQFDMERHLFYEYRTNQTLLDSMSSGVLITTARDAANTLEIKDCNRELEHLLEVDWNNLVGKSLTRVLSNEETDSPLFRALNAEHPRPDRSCIDTVEIRSGRYMKRIIDPIVDEKGECNEFIWFFTDITREIIKGYVDPLTGLFNKRHLKESMSRELERLLRYDSHSPLSLVMLDIDNFKSLNDTFGHPAGDVVLKEVSVILQEAIRNVDIAYRFGGEEFLILLPHSDTRSGQRVAERIRGAIENHTFDVDQRITVSLGIAGGMLAPHLADGNDLRKNLSKIVDELILLADEALYKAKHSGKNKVMIHE